MTWSPAETETLIELWHLGLSCSKIADRLPGLSRNAVIGRAHRLRLPMRGTGHHPNGRCPSTSIRNASYRKPKPSHLNFQFGDSSPSRRIAAPQVRDVPSVVAVPQPFIPIAERIALVDLKDHHCRLILSDGGPFDKRYCGRKTKMGSSYCPDHHPIVWLKPPKPNGRGFQMPPLAGRP